MFGLGSRSGKLWKGILFRYSLPRTQLLVEMRHHALCMRRRSRAQLSRYCALVVGAGSTFLHIFARSRSPCPSLRSQRTTVTPTTSFDLGAYANRVRGTFFGYLSSLPCPIVLDLTLLPSGTRFASWARHALLMGCFSPFCSMSCCYANDGAPTLVGEGGEITTFAPGLGCNGGFKGAGTAHETSGGIRTVEQLC